MVQQSPQSSMNHCGARIRRERRGIMGQPTNKIIYPLNHRWLGISSFYKWNTETNTKTT